MMKSSQIGFLALFLVSLFGGGAFAPSAQAQNTSLYTQKIGEELIFDLFAKQGVPTEALTRSFDFLDKKANQSIVVEKKLRGSGKAKIISGPLQVKSDFAAILDFSLPSTEKRFYLLNFKTGQVEKFYVAHGRNSGGLWAARFSNINGTKQSSLGLYLAGSTYYGGHGKSLNLHGLEASNHRATARDIVLHGADYVSEKFIQEHARLGLSWGCPSVENAHLEKLVKALSNGSLLYFYHSGLMEQVHLTPRFQEFKDPSRQEPPVEDLPGEEEDFQNKRK